MFDRYAIFYTPASGPFADFGAAWLGWNSGAAQSVAQPVLPELDVARLTARPQKYGFHATLKAPFHLAINQSPEALITAVQQFARNHPFVPLGALELSDAHGFIALRPRAVLPALHAFATAVVTEFDIYRAPLSIKDIARRRKSRLSARQDQQMLDWGYPFVFEDFNFHMTLTGPVKRDQMERHLLAIKTLVSPVLPPQLDLDAVTLMGQDNKGMFHQIHRAILVG